MSIPLIRAGALAPILRWLEDHGRDTDGLLQKVDLGWYRADKPLDPILLRQACDILRLAGQQEGPDLPWRVVGDRGFFELGILASIGLQASTPRQILALVQSGMTAHCTHETFSVSRLETGDLVVTDGWMIDFDDAETLHYVHQYCTAMVDLVCRLTKCGAPVLKTVSMIPHPETGFAHLAQQLGDRVSDNGTKVLQIVIPQKTADSRISLDGIEANALPRASEYVPLKEGSSIVYTVSVLTKGMLRNGAVDIDRICAAVGMTRRSLQRGLSVEGATFSQVLEKTRHEMAVDMLRGEWKSMASIAAALGYKDQSAFSRAFKCWEGKTALQAKRDMSSKHA